MDAAMEVAAFFLKNNEYELIRLAGSCSQSRQFAQVWRSCQGFSAGASSRRDDTVGHRGTPAGPGLANAQKIDK